MQAREIANSFNADGRIATQSQKFRFSPSKPCEKHNIKICFWTKGNAPSININSAMSLQPNTMYTPVTVMCAVVDNLVHDLLLSFSAYNK